MSKRTLFEATGALGVIVGLAFVGVQIRQNTTATRAATVLELKQTWVDLNLSLANSPELSTLIRTGHAAVDADGRFRLLAFYRAPRS